MWENIYTSYIQDWLEYGYMLLQALVIFSFTRPAFVQINFQNMSLITREHVWVPDKLKKGIYTCIKIKLHFQSIGVNNLNNLTSCLQSLQ